jgi:polyisoprenoid-binding protein YceI
MMKTIINILLFVLSALSCLQAQAPSFLINTNQSALRWTGKAAFSMYSLAGKLEVNGGELRLNDDGTANAVVSIDMKSLESDDYPRLTKHLKSEDFFDVEKYRLATFSSSLPFQLMEGGQEVDGIMTIKGVEKVEKVSISLTPMAEGWKCTGKIKLNRTDYGVNYNSPSIFSGMKDNAIADEVEIELELFFDD